MKIAVLSSAGHRQDVEIVAIDDRALELDCARAKHLRPLHLLDLRRADADSSSDPATVRLRSGRRRSGRVVDAATIDEACRQDNASDGDAGAAWDMARELARQTRRGERPVEPHMGIENAPTRAVCVAFVALLLWRAETVHPGVVAEALQIVRTGR